MRAGNRAADQLRPVSLQLESSRYAEGSCLIKCGETHVLCTATVENQVPRFLQRTGRGWVTAEYGMLPRATHDRQDRTRILNGGRTQEISRLIGRSLRSVTRLDGFGERQIRIDCDVLQADGGTRTAAITGGFVALTLAFRHLKRLQAIEDIPLTGALAAVSCAIGKDGALLDPDYEEDSTAATDANFVLTGEGALVEVQATAEKQPFSEADLTDMLRLARKGVAALTALQREALAACNAPPVA